MTIIYDVFKRIDYAEDIGNLGNAQKARAVRHQPVEKIDPQMPVVRDRQNLQLRSLARTHHLPGNDIGVMLAFRDYDLISRTDKSFSEAEGDKVDGSGRTRSENDLLPAPGIEEIFHGIAGRLILIRGLRGDEVNGPVKIGVAMLRKVRPFVYDGAGTLDRGRIVEIDKRLAINLAGKGRELCSELLYIHFQTN